MQKKSRLYYILLSQGGFTVIELNFGLTILAGIIIVSHFIYAGFIQTKKNNQLADEIKLYQSAAIKYVNDNYRSIDQQMNINSETLNQDIVVPASGFSGYFHQGALPTLSNYQTPCLYITNNISKQANANSNNLFKAYLVFGTISTTAKPHEFNDAIAVARSFGGNAGVLVPEFDGFSIRGLNDPGTVLSYDLDIGMKCGFTGGHGASGLLDYSIIIDLTRGQELFAQIKTTTDLQSGNQDADPSLKRSGGVDVVTMQTNLYLDNVVKESSGTTSYSCASPAQLPLTDANAICLSFANSGRINMYVGTASWSSNTLSLDQQNCNATARAHFYDYHDTYTCSNVTFANAANYCPSSIGSKNIIRSSAFWSPTPGTLTGNACISNAYAKYQTIGQCSWNCSAMCRNKMNPGGSLIPCHIPVSYYVNPEYPYDSTGTCKNMSTVCHNDSNGNTGSLYSGTISGKYNFATGMCDVYFPTYCSNFAAQSNNPIQTFPTSTPVSIDPNPTYCGQAQIAANITQSQTDRGFLNCTPSKQYPLIASATGIPAQHRYRALDFGPALTVGQRVEIKSNAPSGPAITTSQLSINNAGIRAGYIAPISSLVIAGSACAAVDLGTMTQQQYSTIVGAGGQMQCTYNPVFCGGNGYCHLPIKTPGITYTYSTLQSVGDCPAGSVVATNQPETAVDITVACPILSGLVLTQSVHGEVTKCHEVINGFSFCSAYQTLCTYRYGTNNIQKIPVSALVQLQCTSATNTFTVDNFSQ